MLAGMVRHLPTREAYDLWAEVYDRDGNPLIALEERHIGALIGETAGLAVADVGCGTGRHAVRLAMQGAHVTALDFSPGMLAAAREKPGAERVRFRSRTARSIASCAAWCWSTWPIWARSVGSWRGCAPRVREAPS
jgi:2-polyprenyl-3-methyl-5-hydroxy-6-metoxy-1,4-benzoquinol methylase